MNELQYKSTLSQIEVKEEKADGKLHIKAYGCAFNNIDSYADIIIPTACDKFLASEEAGRMAFCYQHDITNVVGKITDKGVDANGMWIEVDVLPTTSGKDLMILLKEGAIKEFSIGYFATQYHYEKREGYDYDIRILDEIVIREVSAVTIAANPKAVLTNMKSEGAKKMLQEMNDTELMELETAVKNERIARETARNKERWANSFAAHLGNE